MRRLLPFLVLLAGCPPAPPPDTNVEPPPLPQDGCRADLAAADRERAVLAALPYGADGSQADTWAVLRLGTSGDLQDLGERIDVGRSYMGRVRWTPDGSLAVAVLDDGGLGVVAFDGQEPARLVEVARGDWYAGDVWLEPTGEVAWIVDPNWPNNGGGLYRADVDCETGALGPAEFVLESKLADVLLPHPDGPLLVSKVGEDFVAERLDLEGGSREQLAVLFEGDAQIGDATLSSDGAWLLASDNSEWTATPNRVAAVEVATGAHQELPDILDVVSLLPAPSGGGVLAVSGYGDSALWLVEADGAWSVAGPPPWVGASPQLPGRGAVVQRGPLAGFTVVGETEGLRGFRIADEAEDLGLLWTGDGYEGIVGAVGVQP